MGLSLYILLIFISVFFLRITDCIQVLKGEPQEMLKHDVAVVIDCCGSYFFYIYTNFLLEENKTQNL